MALNYLRYSSAPAGTLETEVAKTTTAPQPSAPTASAAPEVASSGTEGDWPSYNRTLTSNRFSPLSQINTTNAGKLKVLCTYDTGQHTGFTSGLLEVNGALIFVTEYDLFSIDPATCREKWRTHEDYAPATPQGVNRGAAYFDGMLFRGTQDGRVLAYDFKNGKRLWATAIADPAKGETVPAAPIAWNGLVFIGDAGGDIKGVEGADVRSGRQNRKRLVWEFYLVLRRPGGGSDTRTRGRLAAQHVHVGQHLQGVPIDGGGAILDFCVQPRPGYGSAVCAASGNPAPDFAAEMRPGSNLYSGSVVVLDAKTGAYRNHFKIVPKDWHDWDVSSAPAIIRTAGGRKVLSVALEGRPPVRLRPRYERAQALSHRQSPASKMRMCHFPLATRSTSAPARPAAPSGMVPPTIPGTTSSISARSSGAPPLRSCRRRRSRPPSPPRRGPGEASINPFNTWGKPDPIFDWAGWTYAVDADTGAWR